MVNNFYLKCYLAELMIFNFFSLLKLNVLYVFFRFSTSRQEQDDECDSSAFITSKSLNNQSADSASNNSLNDNNSNIKNNRYYLQQNKQIPIVIEVVNDSNSPSESKSLEKFIDMSESIINQEHASSAEVNQLLEINVETSHLQNVNSINSSNKGNSFANINLSKSSVILLSPLSGNKIERKRIYTHQNKLNPIIHKNITIMKSKAAAADAAAALKSALQK
jgi:hypothetical protein